MTDPLLPAGIALASNAAMDFPHGRAAADQVEDFSNHRIDAFVGAEGAVVGVVHDVQTNPGQAESHDDFREPETPAGASGTKGNQPPWNEECSQHHCGLEVHAPIALAGFSSFLEVGVNALSEGFAEIGLGPIEANNRNLHGQV